MSVVVTVLLIAALLAASAWTLLLAVAAAVEIVPASAVPGRGAGREELSRPLRSRAVVRPGAG